MKDKLGRDIVVGDTLAYAERHMDLGVELKLAKVTGAAAFALQLTPLKTGDHDPKAFVVSDASRLVICELVRR